MRIACWIFNSANKQREYTILIDFPLQQWMNESASMLCYTYIASLSCLFWMPTVRTLRI